MFKIGSAQKCAKCGEYVWAWEEVVANRNVLLHLKCAPALESADESKAESDNESDDSE